LLQTIPNRKHIRQIFAVHHKGHHVHPLHVLLPQHRDWSSGFWNSVF